MIPSEILQRHLLACRLAQIICTEAHMNMATAMGTKRDGTKPIHVDATIHAIMIALFQAAVPTEVAACDRC